MFSQEERAGMGGMHGMKNPSTAKKAAKKIDVPKNGDTRPEDASSSRDAGPANPHARIGRASRDNMYIDPKRSRDGREHSKKPMSSRSSLVHCPFQQKDIFPQIMPHGKSHGISKRKLEDSDLFGSRHGAPLSNSKRHPDDPHPRSSRAVPKRQRPETVDICSSDDERVREAPEAGASAKSPSLATKRLRRDVDQETTTEDVSFDSLVARSSGIRIQDGEDSYPKSLALDLKDRRRHQEVLSQQSNDHERPNSRSEARPKGPLRVEETDKDEIDFLPTPDEKSKPRLVDKMKGKDSKLVPSPERTSELAKRLGSTVTRGLKSSSTGNEVVEISISEFFVSDEWKMPEDKAMKIHSFAGHFIILYDTDDVTKEPMIVCKYGEITGGTTNAEGQDFLSLSVAPSSKAAQQLAEIFEGFDPKASEGLHSSITIVPREDSGNRKAWDRFLRRLKEQTKAKMTLASLQGRQILQGMREKATKQWPLLRKESRKLEGPKRRETLTNKVRSASGSGPSSHAANFSNVPQVDPRSERERVGSDHDAENLPGVHEMVNQAQAKKRMENGERRSSERLRRKENSTSPDRPMRHDGDKDEQILRYPFEGVGGVTLLNSDLWRLDEGEFLNDTVIEFGLKHMLEKIKGSNPELASQIHLFSSFFYKKLTEFGDRSEKGREKGYNNVKKWTNKVNLFEKRYIVVPINEYLHWYMAIIVNPIFIAHPANPSDPTESGADDRSRRTSRRFSARGRMTVQSDEDTENSEPGTSRSSDITTPPLPDRLDRMVIDDVGERGDIDQRTAKDRESRDDEIRPNQSDCDLEEERREVPSGGETRSKTSDLANKPGERMLDMPRLEVKGRETSNGLQFQRGSSPIIDSNAAVGDGKKGQGVEGKASGSKNAAKFSPRTKRIITVKDIRVGAKDGSDSSERCEADGQGSPENKPTGFDMLESEVHKMDHREAGPSLSQDDDGFDRDEPMIGLGDPSSHTSYTYPRAMKRASQEARKPTPTVYTVPESPNLADPDLIRLDSPEIEEIQLKRGTLEGGGGGSFAETSRKGKKIIPGESRRLSSPPPPPQSHDPFPKVFNIAVERSQEVFNQTHRKVSQSYGSRGQASTQGSPSSPRSRQHGKERGMPEDETLVIVFDSLQSSHGAVKTVMRDYLWLEARDKGQLRDPERNTRETAKVLHVDANVPIQPNHCDCGIYLLHFFDRFFSDPEAFTKLAWESGKGRRRAEKSDSSQWNPELVPTRRQEWRTTILELSEEWKVKRAAEEQEKQERKRRMKKEQHQQHPSPRGLRSGLNHETREGEDDHDDEEEPRHHPASTTTALDPSALPERRGSIDSSSGESVVIEDGWELQGSV